MADETQEMRGSSPEPEAVDVDHADAGAEGGGSPSQPSILNVEAAPPITDVRCEDTPDEKKRKWADMTHSLLTGTGKKSKKTNPGKSVMCQGLKTEQCDLQKLRANTHKELADLRKKEKKLRRVQAKLAKSVKRMSLAEIIAAASMKGMEPEDFKCLDAAPSSATSSGSASTTPRPAVEGAAE